MRFLIICFTFCLITIFGCKKAKQHENECAIPAIVPYQPYSDPVWHPNGQLLGFNHTPQAGVFANGTAPCIWYMNSVKQDSAGFYLMNKDGTGFRRVTNFYLNSPAWSYDGNWIAFSFPPHIYKIRFDGYAFDTAHIIKLTDSGANFYPCWTANSDTIYYDSNVGTNGQGYYVWKMSGDGSGKKGLPNTGRQPFVGSNGKVYFVGLNEEIYQMDRDGSNQVRYSNNGFGVQRPRYWQNKVFYEGNQIGVVQSFGGKGIQLIKPAVTYGISTNGEIVFSKWDYSVNITDKQHGALWIMNADGSNKRQLTFNQF
jgi:Tol biopolymer transport system component